MEVQIGLGADIVMAFDECTEHPGDAQRSRASMELTLRWAARCKKYFEEHKYEVPWGGVQQGQALFGIVQGGMDRELRRESAERTIDIGFPGYAIGGISVGGRTQHDGHIVLLAFEHISSAPPPEL